MPLRSELFRNDTKLEACAVSHPAHITLGAAGLHVSKIQTALVRLTPAVLDATEVEQQRYGSSTAAAVLRYKQERAIINRSYQTQADNIVGIMTIARLDSDMLDWERQHSHSTRVVIREIYCWLVKS
jgi:hypothetical protein